MSIQLQKQGDALGKQNELKIKWLKGLRASTLAFRLFHIRKYLSPKQAVQQVYEVGAETPHISIVFGLGGSLWIRAWPRAKTSSQNCSKLSEGKLSSRASRPKLQVSPRSTALSSHFLQIFQHHINITYGCSKTPRRERIICSIWVPIYTMGHAVDPL